MSPTPARRWVGTRADSLRTMTVRVVGCKVNQVEADMLRSQFKRTGWIPVPPGEPADLVLVHTCTVTGRADRDSRRLVSRARRENPHAAVVVSGCLAQLEPGSFSRMPGVLAVVDRSRRNRAAEIVNRCLGTDNPSLSFWASKHPGMAGRARAWIKVQDGCDETCTYCRSRLARGRAVSRPLAEILDEARDLIRADYQELVLSGVNLGAWRPGLPRLVSTLAALPGAFRLRLSSVEPQHLTGELIQTLADAGDRVCPHLHLPLQSGDDGVLTAMGRRYTAEEFRRKAARLRSAIPGMVLTGDVMVGFPGETPAAFERTCRLVEECELARLHVFPFSPRPGTMAAGLPGRLVNREVTRRAGEIRRLGEELARRHRDSMVGQCVTVLLEQERDGGEWVGTTETYDRAWILPHLSGRLVPSTPAPAGGMAHAGSMVKGRVRRVTGEELVVESEVGSGACDPCESV